jgi:hypothetical protein
MYVFSDKKQYSYFLSFVGISADKLNEWIKVCESFLTSLICPLTVLITVDATSADKSSTLRNDVSGKTIDILNDDPMLLQQYVYKMLVL